MNVIERKAIIRNDKKTTPKDFRLDFKFNICFVDIIKEETSTTLGLVGLNDINEVSSDIIEQKLFMNTTY